ncbi:MAG TPA: addiction module protein [Thermoanaerobaculia bacterium]|nr:addiction module protein [Thermoanaerobaculia bacterium]
MMNAEELESEALKLSYDERERLARALMLSLDSDPEVVQLWVAEAERRYGDYLEGKAEAVPGEEALRRIRAALA